MSLSPTSFAPTSTESGRRILDRLAESHQGPLRRLPAAALTRVFLDTFDWRVWRAGGTLLHDRSTAGGSLRWVARDGRLRRVSRLARAPEFAWDLPSGPWRSELGPVLDVRRLLPVARLELAGESLELLDDEQKIIARVELLDGEVAAGNDRTRQPLPCRLVVRPLRGYEAEARRLRDAIEESAPLAAGGELQLALQTLGVAPDERGGKFRVRLNAAITAGQATRAILRELLAAVLANEPGLRDDLDPEFLHDFRVAVRRARTCLGQLRATLPKAAGRRLRDDLAWLGRATGELRDLDVWLLQLRRDRATLPAAVRDDLIPLRDHLRARRVEVRRQVLFDLDDARYGALVLRWKAIAVADDDAAADASARDALRPVGVVAAERIARRVERMLERGRSIDDNSPDEALHELRIDGKKLRYLFEFYRELFEDRRLRQVLDRLKGLQDTLGEFNDLSVQRSSLERYAGELVAGGLREPGPLLAIGRLSARFDAMAVDCRRRFAARFGRFASAKNVARIDRLLGTLSGSAR